MRKENMVRKGVAVLSVCVLTAGLCSCGTEEKSEEEKILRVVTDERLYTEVESAADFLEGVEGEIEVRIQRLPDDKEEREIEIQKMRTEIMAGKGPDVYLLDGKQENGEEFLPLLENPYQTMQSGALAPLDELMEKDSYWKDDTYSDVILKAGQYDGHQYILPMSVSYYVLPRQQDMEEMSGDTLGEWLEQARNSQDTRLKTAFWASLWAQSGRWIQPAADYERGEVLFNKEKWMEFSDQYFQFHINAGEEVHETDNWYYFEMLSSAMFSDKTSPIDLQVVPDLDGRKMAAIQTYGAVGMSSDLKQEAYDLLMLFLNDRSQKYTREHSEDSMILPQIYGYFDYAFVPVQESAFDAWMHYPPDEELEKMLQSFRELEGAYFLTRAERELYEGVYEIDSQSTYPDYDWNPALAKLADSVWNTYKMMVSE